MILLSFPCPCPRCDRLPSPSCHASGPCTAVSLISIYSSISNDIASDSICILVYPLCTGHMCWRCGHLGIFSALATCCAGTVKGAWCVSDLRLISSSSTSSLCHCRGHSPVPDVDETNSDPTFRSKEMSKRLVHSAAWLSSSNRIKRLLDSYHCGSYGICLSPEYASLMFALSPVVKGLELSQRAIHKAIMKLEWHMMLWPRRHPNLSIDEAARSSG